MPLLNTHVCSISFYLVAKYGLWDQIRVDCGREWFLMLFMNQTVAHLRNNTSKQPHLQTTSKKVYIIQWSNCIVLCSTESHY